jgi:hypothetical protein
VKFQVCIVCALFAVCTSRLIAEEGGADRISRLKDLSATTHWASGEGSSQYLAVLSGVPRATELEKGLLGKSFPQLVLEYLEIRKVTQIESRAGEQAAMLVQEMECLGTVLADERVAQADQADVEKILIAVAKYPISWDKSLLYGYIGLLGRLKSIPDGVLVCLRGLLQTCHYRSENAWIVFSTASKIPSLAQEAFAILVEAKDGTPNWRLLELPSWSRQQRTEALGRCVTRLARPDLMKLSREDLEFPAHIISHPQLYALCGIGLRDQLRHLCLESKSHEVKSIASWLLAVTDEPENSDGFLRDNFVKLLGSALEYRSSIGKIENTAATRIFNDLLLLASVPVNQAMIAPLEKELIRQLNRGQAFDDAAKLERYVIIDILVRGGSEDELARSDRLFSQAKAARISVPYLEISSSRKPFAAQAVPDVATIERIRMVNREPLSILREMPTFPGAQEVLQSGLADAHPRSAACIEVLSMHADKLVGTLGANPTGELLKTAAARRDNSVLDTVRLAEAFLLVSDDVGARAVVEARLQVLAALDDTSLGKGADLVSLCVLASRLKMAHPVIRRVTGILGASSGKVDHLYAWIIDAVSGGNATPMSLGLLKSIANEAGARDALRLVPATFDRKELWDGKLRSVELVNTFYAAGDAKLRRDDHVSVDYILDVLAILSCARVP